MNEQHVFFERFWEETQLLRFLYSERFFLWLEKVNCWVLMNNRIEVI